MSVGVASQQHMQWADTPVKDDPEQADNPALTPADTNALLQGAFPRMDLDQYLNADCGDNFGEELQLSAGFMLPKSEPPSPGSLPTGWNCLQQPDWTAGYDDHMLSDSYGSFNMVCSLGSVDCSSWCSDSTDFGASLMPAEFMPPAMPPNAQPGMIAPETLICAQPNMPAVRIAPTLSASSGGSSDATATADGGKAAGMMVPDMAAAASPTHSSDASDTTPHSTLPASCMPPADATPASGIARAAALMPAVGGGLVTRRAARLSAKPSDAELKEAIAELQRSTTRAPLTVDDAYTSTRAECLERYREKKLRRLHVNTIRYMKRKINADRRPRIKGRFVKAEELEAYHAGLLPGQNGRPPTPR